MLEVYGVLIIVVELRFEGEILTKKNIVVLYITALLALRIGNHGFR